jgi:hypothetical protein
MLFLHTAIFLEVKLSKIVESVLSGCFRGTPREFDFRNLNADVALPYKKRMCLPRADRGSTRRSREISEDLNNEVRLKFVKLFL